MYDLPEPWANVGDGNKRDPDDPSVLKCCYVPPGADKKTFCPNKKDKVCPDAHNCSLPSPQSGKYGARCTAFDSPAFEARWPKSLAPLAPLIRRNSPSGHAGMNFMGAIHPRLKRPVGRRLAAALVALRGASSGARTGPTLSGCAVHARALRLSFNASLLGDEDVMLRPFDANMSQWYTKKTAHGGKLKHKTDSAGLMVCTKRGTSATPHPELNATTCACMEWDVLTPSQDDTDGSLVRYCAVGPGWKPPRAAIARERMKRSGLGPHWRRKLGLGGADANNPFATQWTALAMTRPESATTTEGLGPRGVVAVDLAPLQGQTPLAVRLAWPLFGQAVGKADDACCTSQAWLDGLEPCVPGNCPLYTSRSEQPANPFFANIVESKCVCVAPQTC